MSFFSREAARATDQINASYNGMLRRMVNLPRNIIDGVSRTMANSMNLMTMSPSGGSHNYWQNGTNPSFQGNHFHQNPTQTLPEEWVFLNTFEQQYGQSHPFFYACKLVEALKIAEQEHKLLFMYIHSPEHPFTASFCRNTLCSEVVVEYIDANFVSWGSLASRGEGLQMAVEMRIETFPFCAVVAPASDNSISIIQQVEGPVSPIEQVEILQKALDEQGLAFAGDRRKEEERKRAESSRIREEQDAAYRASLQIDTAKEKSNELPIESVVDNKMSNEKQRRNLAKEHQEDHKGKQVIKKAQGGRDGDDPRKDSEVTQILIRFPNGERRERSFQCNDTIHAIYKYIDSLNLQGVVGYKLISSFPRKVFGFEELGMTLKKAGLHPKGTLFLEIM